jgi:hypothetical protein
MNGGEEEERRGGRDRPINRDKGEGVNVDIFDDAFQTPREGRG